ncbi:myo-inositol 2-dehydrogenase [Alteribacillus persepolensis]|uniref:Myo-inositol 2-dehydrogenase n=1 Tax=Alteribacillus persepolensis TaxID=568899 RepID=A0A1G8GKC6_9BACI|nr:inositol 2-dehydrogenase [Alteribacillus persepolensis]SDH94766.1 myo-inositol 2-dehydrogenase [Alteribacillus persepolensis]
MKETIRCAVLGLGRLGYWHAENLAHKVKGAELAAVADPMDGKAEQVARELGVEKFSQNPDEIFEDPEIDAVAIITPTNTHADMIKKAAAHKKHIFTEKPITETVQQAEEVVEAVQKNNVFCQVGFMRRFDPAYVEAKKRMDAGEIGKPLYFKGVTRDGATPPPEFIKNSGGLYLDFSIHDYDAARFLLDADVNTVTAHGSVLQHTYVKEFGDVDQALTYLTFDTGAAADIEASRNVQYGYDIRAEVVGTHGAIQVGSLKNNNVQVLTSKGSTHDIVPDFPALYSEAYLQEMVSFINCLRKGEKPLVDEMDGKAALEIAAAATKSYQENKTIRLCEESSVNA